MTETSLRSSAPDLVILELIHKHSELSDHRGMLSGDRLWLPRVEEPGEAAVALKMMTMESEKERMIGFMTGMMMFVIEAL